MPRQHRQEINVRNGSVVLLPICIPICICYLYLLFVFGDGSVCCAEVPVDIGVAQKCQWILDIIRVRVSVLWSLCASKDFGFESSLKSETVGL